MRRIGLGRYVQKPAILFPWLMGAYADIYRAHTLAKSESIKPDDLIVLWGLGGRTRHFPAAFSGFLVEAPETRLGGTGKADAVYVSGVGTTGRCEHL